MKTLKIPCTLLLTFLLCFTCSQTDDADKTEPNNDYYITFEINGETKTYTDVLSFDFYGMMANNIYGAGIVSANGSGPNAGEAILMYVYDTNQITTDKTYTEAMIPDKYLSSATIAYGKAEMGYTSAAPNISSVSKARITLTEITDTYVSGTFNAVLVTNQDYNTAAKTIKNGTFKIKINN